MAEPKYTKPTSTLDLEARQKKDYVNPAHLVKGVDPATETENGYIGVDPIYQNFSEVGHKPFVAESGAEAKVEKPLVSSDVDLDAAATPEGERDAEEDAEDQKDDTQGASGGSGSPAPTPAPSTPPKP